MQTPFHIVCVMLALVFLPACNSSSQNDWSNGTTVDTSDAQTDTPSADSDQRDDQNNNPVSDQNNSQNNSQSNDQVSDQNNNTQLTGLQTPDNTSTDASAGTTTSADGQPVVVPATIPAGSSGSFPENITDLILVTGQSNALGADTSFDAARDTVNDRVYAFTDQGWQIADLHQVWDLNWHPRNDPETDPSNNFAFHFGKKVAERRPQKVVGFILVTAPGQGISHWDYEGEFYWKIRNKVTDAINQLPNKAAVDGILWHQGETDWTANDYYRNKLRDLINNFRSESWFATDKPFICGETVAAPVNSILMALNNDGDQHTGCVAADGLSTILDKLHFSAEGLRILGTRYATKYLQMTEQ